MLGIGCPDRHLLRFMGSKEQRRSSLPRERVRSTAHLAHWRVSREGRLLATFRPFPGITYHRVGYSNRRPWPQFPNGIVRSVSILSTTNTARRLAGFPRPRLPFKGSNI